MTDTTSNLGVIEGFFGDVWSWEQRAAYAHFLQTHGFQFYIYAPKGDAFLRRRWQESWSESERTALSALSDTLHQHQLAFGVGLSPFELYLDYNEESRARVRSKVLELNELQVDILCILFDDMKGDVPRLAELQAEIVHEIQEVSTASRLIMCPSYYSFDPVLERHFGTMPDNYLSELGERLHKEIDIFWTGEKVCSKEYPTAHLQEVTTLLGRKPFLWDNYPVNDGARMSRFLHLRPFPDGRHLPALTAGHAANPMNQAWLSQLPLLTLPQSYQNPSYDRHQAFTQACETLCPTLTQDLLADLSTFQDQGLDQMGEQKRDQLIAKYAAYQDNPYAQEIVAWLRGEYTFDPACLTG